MFDCWFYFGTLYTLFYACLRQRRAWGLFFRIDLILNRKIFNFSIQN
jgi:hypothetical protein